MEIVLRDLDERGWEVGFPRWIVSVANLLVRNRLDDGLHPAVLFEQWIDPTSSAEIDAFLFFEDELAQPWNTELLHASFVELQSRLGVAPVSEAALKALLLVYALRPGQTRNQLLDPLGIVWLADWSDPWSNDLDDLRYFSTVQDDVSVSRAVELCREWMTSHSHRLQEIRESITARDLQGTWVLDALARGSRGDHASDGQRAT